MARDKDAPKYANFASLAKSLHKSADASLGYISKGDTLSVIPTGSIVLDNISCKGGIPVQRITQIASEPGVGKSTCALTIAASCQRLGGTVLYLDFEQSLTAEYIEQMGCVLDDETMIFAQPTDIDAGWKLIDIASNLGVNLVILDSIASMFPSVDDEDFRNLKTQVGYQAKGLMLFVPRLKTLARVKNFAVLMINQVRAKISMGWGSQFQKSPAYALELPGGFIPKFYTDLLIYLTLRKTEKEDGRDLTGKKDDVYTGHELVATSWKNKIGVPFKRASMYLEYGRGINDFRSVMEFGLSLGFIDYNSNGGAWCFLSQGDYPGVAAGEPILQGRGKEGIPEAFAANQQAYDYLRSKVISIDFVTDSAAPDEIASINKLISDESPSGSAMFNAPASTLPAFPVASIGNTSFAPPTPAFEPPPIPVKALEAAAPKKGRPKKS